MEFFTTVPIIFGRPINVWLGVILIFLLTFQIVSGVAMARGRMKFLRYHKINAVFLIIVIFLHAYYGLGIWFFHFKTGF